MKIYNLISSRAPTQEIFEAIKTATIEEINYKNQDWETPLHLAASWGRLEITKALIDAGAKVNAKDIFGMTPLHDAALYGRFEIAKFLIDAAPYSLFKITEFLIDESSFTLKARANLSVVNCVGETPLDVAKRIGHQKIVELLENYQQIWTVINNN